MRFLAIGVRSRTACRMRRNVSMKHKTLFTFGDNDQYEVIDTKCLACRGDLWVIEEEDGVISLPICLVCEKAIQACERDLDIKQEE